MEIRVRSVLFAQTDRGRKRGKAGTVERKHRRLLGTFLHEQWCNEVCLNDAIEQSRESKVSKKSRTLCNLTAAWSDYRADWQLCSLRLAADPGQFQSSTKEKLAFSFFHAAVCFMAVCGVTCAYFCSLPGWMQCCRSSVFFSFHIRNMISAKKITNMSVSA